MTTLSPKHQNQYDQVMAYLKSKIKIDDESLEEISRQIIAAMERNAANQMKEHCDAAYEELDASQNYLDELGVAENHMQVERVGDETAKMTISIAPDFTLTLMFRLDTEEMIDGRPYAMPVLTSVNDEVVERDNAFLSSQLIYYCIAKAIIRHASKELHTRDRKELSR